MMWAVDMVGVYSVEMGTAAMAVMTVVLVEMEAGPAVLGDWGVGAAACTRIS